MEDQFSWVSFTYKVLDSLLAILFTIETVVAPKGRADATQFACLCFSRFSCRKKCATAFAAVKAPNVGDSKDNFDILSPRRSCQLRKSLRNQLIDYQKSVSCKNLSGNHHKLSEKCTKLFKLYGPLNAPLLFRSTSHAHDYRVLLKAFRVLFLTSTRFQPFKQKIHAMNALDSCISNLHAYLRERSRGCRRCRRRRGRRGCG